VGWSVSVVQDFNGVPVENGNDGADEVDCQGKRASLSKEHRCSMGYADERVGDHGCVLEVLVDCDGPNCSSRRFSRRRSSHHATTETNTNEPGMKKTTK
jgi:hypothetical protein